MKVALELQPCYWARSGIGTYTYELARRLTDRDGLEFCGNLFNLGGRKDNAEFLAGVAMPLRENKWMHYGVYRRLWNCLPLPYGNMFPNDADLSLFFNFIVPPGVRGRVATVVHDLTYLRYPETMKESNWQHLSRGMPSSIERSDRIITVSEFTKRELQELLHIPAEKISVVYNAPSLVKESVADTDVREKYGIPGEYILFVGTVEPRKNIERLLRAFELLKNEQKIPHKLVLAGGKGWQDECIFETVKQLRHADDVIFTGFVSAAEKNTLYQNASVFVFPSIYEGFGIPPLEAMSWGCPVVCANAASLPEVVGGAAELVDPFCVESIAEGMLRVLSDTDYAKKLCELGRAQAKRFSWDASAEQLIAVCKDVLEKK